MLTTPQIESFHRDGFTIVRNAISPETLRRLREETDAWMDRSRGVAASNEVFDLQPGHSAEHPRVNRINHPVACSPLYWEVATSPAVLDCVAALLGDDVRFHHSKLNLKSAEGGAAIGWHQDYAFFPHTNFDLAACGIALDDATLENGCLLVIPGTHRGPILSHRNAEEKFVGQITDPDAATIEEKKAVPVELRAGDMSIHHASVIHGSVSNTSTKNRRLLIFQYAAADAFPFEPPRQTNDHGGRVVRGSAPTHARMAGSMRIRLRGDTTGAKSLFAVQGQTPSMM